MSRSRHIVVIGGGAVGLASALELARAGTSVTLVERNEVGRGCSEGNAGWVTPAIALPIAAPGLRSQGLRWFLQRDSPLYVRAASVPALLPWLWSFWSRCTPEAFEAAAATMMPFARDAVDRYARWNEELDDVEYAQKGLLMAFRTEEALQGELELLERFKYGPASRLDPSQLAELEPQLAERPFSGGLHVVPEAHVEPLSVARALARRCRELGAEILENTAATELIFEERTAQKRVVAIRLQDTSSTASIECDGVVVATGAESGRFAAACGTRIPLQAGKGYSVTLQPPDPGIDHPLYLAEAKIGITPFADSLRVAGTLELSGINTRLDQRRLEGVLRSAKRELPGLAIDSARSEWVGMRPMTPDGLPVIGRCPRTDNVWLNTAHQMLGITLAPRSGDLLARLVLGDELGEEDSRFAGSLSPERF